MNRAYAMRFLMGLNEIFSTIRSQILMSDPIPPISKVYSLVLQVETQKNISHWSFQSQNDATTLYANSTTNSGNNGNSNFGNKNGIRKQRPFCTHCNILGYTVDKCYKLQIAWISSLSINKREFYLESFAEFYVTVILISN